MARRILLKWYQSRFHYQGDVNVIDGIRLRVEASEATEMPAKIFAYLLMPMKPSTLEKVGAFDHVCSPVDLEEYPEDEPIPHHQPAFFRLAYVDILVRSEAERLKFQEDLRADVKALKASLDILDTVELAEEEWIDEAPAESSSAGSSNSSEGSSEGG